MGDPDNNASLSNALNHKQLSDEGPNISFDRHEEISIMHAWNISPRYPQHRERAGQDVRGNGDTLFVICSASGATLAQHQAA